MKSWWFIHGMRLTRAKPHSQMEAARSMRREEPKASTESLALHWRRSVSSAGQHGSFQASPCEFTSPQKVAADKSMSGFPSQNLRHHASHWCTSRCLVSQQAQTRSFFYPPFDLFCGLVLKISKDGKNSVKVLCASLPQKRKYILKRNISMASVYKYHL